MAKAIMIQGTMSNAGKSLLAAGLCRIFHQDGYRVAPFKSQNMALNSYITEEGLEMGRAQVMQAEAAGIRPSVLMNPILLKPTNDVGSQVIVNGEVLGNMNARDYFKYKHKLIPDIMKAYNTLAAENDIIVIEGAGSPAEINLKQEDIVNMGMAKMAKAPVLLVGDIDRGGVFAQLIGTVMLLEEDEKAMVKGMIINKFRGDKSILDPGVEMLEQMSQIPVVGVAPYLQIEVEDEDSLTERFDSHREVGVIDIAVIRLPRISNFTDFNPFESMPGVSLRYVKKVSELKNPDMICIPGTKNTMEDLQWMRESGMEAAVLKQAAEGKVIFGICGGYQMLGETLADPEGVEAGGSMKGMGLLPMDTIFASEKTRTRVSGVFQNVEGDLQELSGTVLEGYEIHMGVSTLREGSGTLTFIRDHAATTDQKNDGAYYKNVYGTYVHGVFDKEEVAKAIISALGRKKGINTDEITGVDFQKFKETQYDILADALREHLDMKKIYKILEEGI
ncbi:MAG: cobyric acid synthase [Oliverpabstia sp.]